MPNSSNCTALVPTRKPKERGVGGLLLGLGVGMLPVAVELAFIYDRLVCLCGSTRFKETFLQEAHRLTLEGRIVLMPHVFAHADGLELGEAVKTALNKLHLEKIRFCKEVRVLNVDGYIGESTARELAYAQRLGKQVSFLEPHEGASEQPPPPPRKPTRQASELRDAFRRFQEGGA